MGEIGLEQLLQPLSDESPCGDNLEYDQDFYALEDAAKSKPEQQMGESKIPGEDPNWGKVREVALELLRRTKDLRVVNRLASASLAASDWTSFRDALALLRGYVGDFWGTIHPQSDPEDDDDPTVRVNVLAGLCDADTVLALLREAKLAEARGLGSVSLRLWQIANGELPAAEGGEELPDANLVQAILMECDGSELEGTATVVAESIDLLKTIEATVTATVGAGQACSFEPLVGQLKKISHVLAKPLEERNMAQATSEAADGDSQVPAAAGKISTRQDVIRVLDEICKFYEQNEPSSPVPLLLARAKRVASKTFLEIIQDLSPGGLKEIRVVGGIEDGEKSSK